jgi:8-oxo-dGTP diphosphatase
MPVLSCTTFVDAPRRLVAGMLRDSEAAREALGRAGHDFSSSVRLLAPGDEAVLVGRVLPGVRLSFRTRILRVSPEGMTSVLVGGLAGALTHTTTLTDEDGGTRLTDEVHWTSPFGPLGRVADAVLVRRLMRDILAVRAAAFIERAAEPSDGRVVVATALVRDGRVLAARRAYPPELAGRWELPGGRVEQGESEADALSRECREELGTDAVARERLGTDLPVPGALVRVYVADPAPGAAEPEALEHLEIRWVGAGELATLGWVEADRAVVADLQDLLAPG